MAQYAAATARNPDAMPARTAVEQGLIGVFEHEKSRLPGQGWVAQLRAEAMASFAATGLPSSRGEAWRYTNLRDRWKEAFPAATSSSPGDVAALDAALGSLAELNADRLVILDGTYSPALSRTDGLISAAEHMPLAPLLAKAPAWLEGKFAAGRLVDTDGVVALNTALMSDGVMLKIKPGAAAERPILLIHARSSPTPAMLTTRNIIAMEPGSRATIVEIALALPGAAGASVSNCLTDITIADGAVLEHLKLVDDHASALVLSNTALRMAASSTYRAYHLTLAAGLTRHGLHAHLGGAGSTIDVTGAFLGDAQSHTDTTLTIDHQAPSCISRELFKGVLADRARGVFQGKVIVRPGAQKTDGKQMAQALLLSPDAEFDSKPELEIYADDVACGHGSTAAEIDNDHIFYLRARGIPLAQARALLTRAFVAETLDKIEDEALRACFAAMMDHWLDQRAARWAGERT